MALATKCPHCNTIFRVAHDQLKLRGGIVRCGACNEVFDGNAALVEPAPKQPVIIDLPATHGASPDSSPELDAIMAALDAPDDEAVYRLDLGAVQEAGAEPAIELDLDVGIDAAEAEAAPEAEPTLAPEPEPEPELDIEPEFEPEPELDVEPELEPEPALDVEPEPELKPGFEPEPEPESDVEPEPEPEPEPELDVEPEPEPEPELDVEPEFEPEPELDVEPESEPEPERELALQPEAEPEQTTEPALPAAQQAVHALHDGRREPSFDAEPDEHLVAAPLPEDGITAERVDTAALPAAAEHASPADAADAPEPELEEPGFVQRDRRRQQFGKAARVAMVAGIPLLLMALVAQGVNTFRNQLAASVPALKPALVSICGAVGCKVELPAQIDYLSIEQGELQALAETRFSFATSLRNQSRTVQSWPHIELILNDSADKPVLRRVFAPRDYLAAPADAAQGFAPRTEQSVKLYFELAQVKASGYHIAIFYP